MIHTLQYWPEIHHHIPEAVVILVATKIDLREDAETLQKLAEKKQTLVTKEEGIALAKEINAYCCIF
jgi:Ras-related C3 botulinum toxin substrate 1